MADCAARMPRRRVMEAGLVAALALAVGPAKAGAQQKKMSKGEARYQDTPKDGHICAECALFLLPHSCRVVDGEISRDGWCKFFDMVD